MPRKTSIESADEKLTTALAKWLIAEQKSALRVKQLPEDQLVEYRERANRLVSIGSKNRSLQVLEKNGRPLAMVALAPARMPRVKGQQALSFFFDRSKSKDVYPWLARQLTYVGKSAPVNTASGLSSKDDAQLGRALSNAGFGTRYEILAGETKIAHARLSKTKKPPRDLAHLGLEMRPLAKLELDAAMKLQKKISLLSKSHSYFSHTPAQLRQDRLEYEKYFDDGTGLILGIFRKSKLVGMMIVSIHGEPGTPKHGGFSFFLDPSIQGKGITKTGYLVLLEFLLENGVESFYGGTSQPAIQALGKVMKRKVRQVIYVKMER